MVEDRCLSGADHTLGDLPGTCEICADYGRFLEAVSAKRDEMFDAIVSGPSLAALDDHETPAQDQEREAEVERA